MKTNRDYFINFTAAIGGERRAPRRAAAAAARSAAAYVGPIATSQALENKFDAKVADSQRNGVWGGSEEIQAFCQSYGQDVRVYTDAGIQTFRDVNAPACEERDVVHIAFHVRFPAWTTGELVSERLTNKLGSVLITIPLFAMWTAPIQAFHAFPVARIPVSSCINTEATPVTRD